MRSRYSAFALNLTDYLLASWHASTRPTTLVTAPPSILNQEGGPRRTLMTVDLPLIALREAGRRAGGSISDLELTISQTARTVEITRRFLAGGEE